ncbi:MAG: cation diffusion facilitator family transporter [Gammaproteobacteria bacterium]
MGHTHLPDPRHVRYSEIRKVTLIGSVVDLVLGVVKIAVGLFASSQALVADGVHSLSDLATDFLVIFAAKHAHREADEEHPYGHGRIETVATVVLGSVLTIVAVGISIDALRRLASEEARLVHGMWALAVALLSVASKEYIYHYTVRVARRLRSNMLHANAWHSRSDAISSIIVVIGVGGAMAGFHYLDEVAAIAVALMIAKIGWDLLWTSLQELIDRALEPELVEDIRQRILEVNGVRACHMLRTRSSGSDSLVDVHIQVDPMLSVSEGHQIGERVRKQLISEVEHVADVTVHIDPEDDELASPCDQLPLRDVVLARLAEQWQGLDQDQWLERVVLHYLDGKVHVDVFVRRLDLAPEARARLSATIRERAGQANEVGEVLVYFGERAP